MPAKKACPSPCNVLLVGGGGREHALAWKMKQSPTLGRLWTTNPENAGIASLAEPCDVPLDLKHYFRMARWCDQHDIHLVVVGPEVPLAAGIADELRAADRLVFGPVKAGARLEADKAFSKELMRAVALPTADARVFRNVDDALAYAESREEGLVVKAAGLAAGKGVIVCSTPQDTCEAIRSIMSDRAFGEAGDTIVVEERLQGQEVSVLALTDGRSIWVLDPCQDHKPVGEGDTGPNTGGMGAYCPASIIDDDLMRHVERQILVPIVDGLKREGIDYRGVLYAGLMLTPGGPKVLEFNCRFGDPECQPLMVRLRGDLVRILWATAAGTLNDVGLSFDPRVACTVVVCSGGYPGSYEKGKRIEGLGEVESMEDVIVFHAGTRRLPDGTVVTNGGRVLSVTAVADNLPLARDRANEAASLIRFDGAFFRRDIGGRVL